MYTVRRNFCLGLALALLSLCGCSQSGVPAATSAISDTEISTQAATSILRVQDVPESVCKEIIALYEKDRESSTIKVVVPFIDYPTAAIIDTRAIQAIDIPIERYDNTLASDGTPALLTYKDYTSLLQSGEPLAAKHYLPADRPIYKEDLVFEKDLPSESKFGWVTASPAHTDTVDIVVAAMSFDSYQKGITRDSVTIKTVTNDTYTSMRDVIGLEFIRADEWDNLWASMSASDCPYTMVMSIGFLNEGDPIYKSRLYIGDGTVENQYRMQSDGTVVPR